MKRYIIWGLFFLSGISLFAQNRPYFPFFQQEYFFGLLPSARAEALGRTGTALTGSTSSYYYNPAAIGTIKDWAAEVGTSGPYYLLRESDYYFTGFSKRLHPKLVAGLNLYQFAMGPNGFSVNIGNDRYPVDRPRVADLAATIAAEPVKGLHIGLNAHLFNWKIFEGVSTERSFFLDLGALYTRTLANGDQLTAGLGIVNITGSQISFEAPDGASSSNAFPIITRIGATYQKSLEVNFPGAGSQPLLLLFTTEYQDLLNSDVRSAFRLGTEATLADFLSLRLGLFTRTEDDMGVANNRDGIVDLTYGFGLVFPFDKLTKGAWPVRLSLDYYAFENPPLIFSGTRQPNKRGFSIRLISTLSQS